MQPTPVPPPDRGPHAVLQVRLAIGARALVAGDLRLGADDDPGAGPAGELVQALEAWTGPGVLILNGNTLELDPGSSVAGLLDRHAALVGAVGRWAAARGRQVVILPGDRDAALGWSAEAQGAVTGRLGAEVALAVDLAAETGSGDRRVPVEPGHQLDPPAPHDDPCNPAATPLSDHLRLEVIPAVAAGTGRRRDWLAGMPRLDDPAAFPRFVASRLTYRALGRRAWLLLVPVALAIALRVPSLVVAHATGLAHSGSARLLVVVVAALVELALLAGLAVGAVRRTWGALSVLTLGARDAEPNRDARDRARRLVVEGYRGFVTGHTCRPELSDLGPGFFANSGCLADVVTEHPVRLPGLGLPPAYLW